MIGQKPEFDQAWLDAMRMLFDVGVTVTTVGAEVRLSYGETTLALSAEQSDAIAKLLTVAAQASRHWVDNLPEAPVTYVLGHTPKASAPAPRAPTFQLGDLVEVAATSTRVPGIGRVVGGLDAAGWDVVFDSVLTAEIPTEDLVTWVPFAVGDRVKLLDNIRGLDAGEIGTVRFVDLDEVVLPYRVDFDGVIHWLRAKDVERVCPAASNECAIRDACTNKCGKKTMLAEKRTP